MFNYRTRMIIPVFFVVILAVVHAAQGDIDVMRLFHSDNTPTTYRPQPKLPGSQHLEPSTIAPSSIPSSPGTQATDQTAYSDDQFIPYRSSRHDEFDWALTKNILSKSLNGSNTIISPFLVKLLLSILAEAAGSETSTHRELLSVLPSVQSNVQTRELYGKIFGSLLQKSEDYELNLGTKLYVDHFIEPRQRYQAIIKSFYYSDVETVDFSNAKEAAAIINSWVSNITHNHIKDIATEEDAQRAVILLLNAIYFNGFWRRPFPDNQTTSIPFYTNSATRALLPFMVRTGDYYYLESKELDSRIIRLPYKGRKFAMYIVLPNQIDGLNDLVNRVDSSTLHRAQWLMDITEIKVCIPKFKFENAIHLNDVLKELGIKQMFTMQASLPLLARGSGVENRLQVSNVLQKTGIDVNERGSTIYAATQISLSNKFGAEHDFIADRPFLFLIEDETTGTLLFSGKVTKPEY